MAGYVYLIGSNIFKWYKIGKSKSATVRLSDIGILLPFRVELIALWKSSAYNHLEKQLHKRLSANRINGEWFGLSEDEIEALKLDMLYLEVQGQPIAFSNLTQDYAPAGKRVCVKFFSAPKGSTLTDENRQLSKRRWAEYHAIKDKLTLAERRKYAADILAETRGRAKHFAMLENIHLTMQ